MSFEKNINTRVQHKHDIEINWNKAINFIPKAGEIIIYDADANNTYSRIKIGDGVKTVSALDFINDGKANKDEVTVIQIITWGADD